MPHELTTPRVVVASGMSGTGVSAVSAHLQDAAPDLNIVDAGHRWSDISEACAPGFARMIVVTTHDIIAITSSYALIKLVRDRFTDAPIELLVNASEARDALRTYERIQVACSHFLGETVGYAGSVPGGMAGQEQEQEQEPGEKRTTHSARAELGADSVAAIQNLATRLDEELEAATLRNGWRHGEGRVAL
jgi:MinD-like ATPase involved in chromosome partitioning or flagellar assembly